MTEPSFDITLKKISFSIGVANISQKLIGFGGAIILVLVLILEVPNSPAKALIGGTNFFVYAILIGGTFAFVGFLMIMYGGNKSFKGRFIIQKNDLHFDLKKNSFSLKFDEIEGIVQQKRMDDIWEWEFNTVDGRFSVLFKSIPDRYVAAKALQEAMQDEFAEKFQDEKLTLTQ